MYRKPIVLFVWLVVFYGMTMSTLTVQSNKTTANERLGFSTTTIAEGYVGG